jgi:hypothetical protein
VKTCSSGKRASRWRVWSLIAVQSLRVPGALAGQIKIHPEFDVLPDDIAEAFGAGAK